MNGLKFISNGELLERSHPNYNVSKKVKPQYFESPNQQNIQIRTYTDGFAEMKLSQRIVISKENFNKLPADPIARSSHALALMGWT